MISFAEVHGFTLQRHIAFPAQSSSYSISCRLVDIQEMITFLEEYPTQNQVLSLRKHRLSYTRALELKRRQLRAVGLKPGEYGQHSMRAGGARLAAALGIPDRLIMRQGGWRSEKSKNNYIRETKDALLQVSRSFAL